jgi:hypothetical protein
VTDDVEAGRSAFELRACHQLLEEAGEDCVERGYLLVPEAIGRFDDDLQPASTPTRTHVNRRTA